MKKRTLSTILALAMLISVFAGAGVVGAAETVTDQAGNAIEVVGGNLVQNPSFEQSLGDEPWNDPNPGGGWTVWGMNNNNIETNPDGLTAPDGSKIFHLVLSENANDNWATLKQTVALEAGKSYIFTAELASPHNAGLSIGVSVVDDNGRINSFSREKDANGVLEFQKVSATFSVPESAENPKAVISSGLGETSNQKYIDKVEIYEIADPSKVTIEEEEGAVFTGDVTIKLKNETKELELKLVGDNGNPTIRYDNRSKYMSDIMFNVNRDFGSADTTNTTHTQIPVDVYDEETLEAAKNIVKANPKSNPLLSTDYIDSYIEQMVALRPGYMNYLAQALEWSRMDITLVPVSNPWWQYMRLEEGQTEYTEEQWRYFYKQLWSDSWKHGFMKGYIYAKYFGQTNYNMGNEPDNKDNGQTKFIDWTLYGLEAVQLSDGFKTGVEAAGYNRDEAQTWGPTLAGWNTAAWDAVAAAGDEGIDVYDYHTYGGGTYAHDVRIQNFKNRIEEINPDGQIEKVSASEFNWQLSGDSFDWLDKMPGCISHIQIMREQALQGLYASIRFSFPEMFFQDSATGRYLIPERMFYAIRQFTRTLTEGNVLVEYDLMDAGSSQEFFVTKGENSYFVHLINNNDSDETTALTVDLSEVGVADGSAAVLREMSEDVNDAAVAFTEVQDGQVRFENLKSGAMYLVEIAYTDFEVPAPEIHRAFGYVDSAEVWWTNKPYYSGFDVYRSTDGENYTLVASDIADSWYEDTDVSEGVEYYYYVVAKAYDKTSSGSTVAGPVTLKPSGALPYMGDFEGGTLAGFDVVGDFEVEEYQYVHNAVGTAQPGEVSMLINGGSDWTDYTVDTTVSVRRLEEGSDSYGKIGMLARYVDENNYYKCILDSVARTVSITKVKDGQETLLGETPIPEAFQINEGKTIPMNLIVDDDKIYFYAAMSAYDPPVGQRSASVTVYDSDFPTGKTGIIVADGAKMSFSSIKVVEAFSDLFSGGASDKWEEHGGTWSAGVVDDGTVANWWYTQSDDSGDDWKMSLVTSGGIIDGYVAGKIMTDGTAAFIAKYVDDDNFLRYQVEGDTLSVISRVNGVETVEQTAQIPEHINPYVTLHIEFDKNYQTVNIAGQNVLTYHLWIPALATGKFGVATKGSTASFDQFIVSATSVAFEMPYFLDTQEHWAKDSIAAMAEWGYVRGIDAENYGPDQTLTRGQYAVMLANMTGVPEDYAYNNIYTDVTADQYYASAVQWLSDKGIIPAEMAADGAFSPDQDITREEIAALSVKTVQAFKKYNSLAKAELSEFTDAADVSDWAEEYVEYAFGTAVSGVKIMNGRTETELAPQGTATRAEAAVFLQRTYTLMYA